MKKIAAVALTALVALTLASCGDGVGETTSTTAASTPAAPKPPLRPAGASGAATRPGAEHRSQGEDGGHRQGGEQSPAGSGRGVPGDTSASFAPPAHRDSPTGTAPFETKGGDNSIQESGAEASGSELRAAAVAMHGYLDARAAGAWVAACQYLAPGVTDQLARLTSQNSGAKAPSCAELLAGLSAPIPAAALREVAIADVGAFRVEGESGFLLFHGAQGVDYFMPMAREGGAWKVAAIAASALM